MGCSQSSAESADPNNSYISASKVPGVLDYSGQGLVCIPPIPKSVQVSKLLLANNFLTTLPRDVNFDCLVELDISSNRFVRIPAVLKKLPNLESLNVSNNPLSRTGGYDELPNFPALKNLRLALCSVRKFPPPLAQCANLESLDLNFNHFVELTGPDLPGLKNLKSLSVASCTLRGQIPSGITNSETLTSLNISSNSLDLSSANAFGPNLEKNLRVLNCNSTNMKVVPKAVVNLQNLEELYVSKNKNISLNSFRSVSSKLAVLCVSECELATLPEGISAVSASLTSLDISGNEEIDVLGIASAVPKLKRLSVLGCRFAAKGDGRDLEWFELAELTDLHEIEWNVWGESKKFQSGFSTNPYSTRFPIQLCALQLIQMNGLTVRPNLFTGDRISALQNILKDGYYKVDFLFESIALSSHHQTLELLLQQCDRIVDHLADPVVAAILRERYAFFMYLQALHPESVLLPPIDVIALHMAHMCEDPSGYSEIGLALFGSIVDNNYRIVIMDDIEASESSRYKEFWNAEAEKLYRSAPEALGENFKWLRYETTIVAAKNPFASAEGQAAPNHSFSSAGDVPTLLPLLDPKLKTKTFSIDSQPLIARFMEYATQASGSRDSLEVMGNEAWTRYAKYLSICAESASAASSPTQPATEHGNESESKVPASSTAETGCGSSGDWKIAPTFAIKDVIYLHRTAPVKYDLLVKFLKVSDLGCNNNLDSATVKCMNERWTAMFDEPYVKSSKVNFENSGGEGEPGNVLVGEPGEEPKPSAPSSPKAEDRKKKRRVTIGTLDM